MGPNLGQVEGVPAEGLGLFFGHHLNFERPSGEVALVNGGNQVALAEVQVLALHGVGAGAVKVLDALLGLKVKLDVHTLVLGV